jgi:predicted MFS family arabinose efflux permease
MRGVIARFHAQRGLAIGLTMMCAGLLGSLTPTLVNATISSWDWRAGYAALAGLSLILGVPVVYMAFDKGVKSQSGAKTAQAPTEAAAPSGLSLQGAIRTRSFWQLQAALLLTGGVLSAFVIHLVPLLTDAAISRSRAVGLASLLGVAGISSRVIFGFLVDRIFAPFVAAALFALAAGALAAFGLCRIDAAVAAPLGVIAAGLALGCEGSLMTFLTPRYFGRRSFSEIGAWMQIAFVIGQATFPLAAGMAFDDSHSYRISLLTGGGILAVCVVLFATLGRYTHDSNS